MKMSSHGIATQSAPVTIRPGSTVYARPRLLLAAAILVAVVLGELSALAKFRAVWATGAFFDTDDAMRAVEVRDLAAGQGWFDMTAHRLDPPDGVFMHWSRVVDAPLLLLSKGFGLVADPAMAERLTRLAFPALLTCALFALLVALCERLLGRSVRYFALTAAFLYGPATGQFEPGRIDHHSPQIVLLVAAISALACALTCTRPRFAALAGAAISLSMAISLENVPFFVAFLGALILIWVLDGARVSQALAWFAGGLLVCLPVVYVATIAPARWMIVASDALSLAQAAAMALAAGVLMILAFATPSLQDSRGRRFVLAAGVASVAAISLALIFPALAESPFAHLDPIMRVLWLDGVDEAQPLLRKFASDPFWTLGLVAPAMIGLAGALWSARRAERTEARVWLLLAITLAAGLAASFAMVRTFSAVLALAVPGALALAMVARARLAAHHRAFGGPLAGFVLVLSLSTVGWAAACNQVRRVVPGDQTGAPVANAPSARVDFGACTTPAAFTALARLPPGLVLSEPDLGAYILAHTPHAVVAGAYHRNVHGMKGAIEALVAPPGVAQARVDATGADYVVYCRAALDRQFLDVSPTGLAAQLSRQHAPAWLRHLAAEQSVLDIYSINRNDVAKP